MKKFLQETKLLLLFFLFLTVATVISFIDFKTENKTAKSPTDLLKDSAISKLDTVREENNRSPASTKASSKTEMLNAEFFCEKKEQARFKKSMKSLVILNFKVCEDLKSSRHIWVKNVTNGFRAQIFNTNEKNFRTDFIQLNLGDNKLVIEAVLKDGQKMTQSLEIISGS